MYDIYARERKDEGTSILASSAYLDFCLFHIHDGVLRRFQFTLHIGKLHYKGVEADNDAHV